MRGIKTTMRLAIRNLVRQKGRSLSLATAIAFGCAILTLVYGAIGGMRASLLEKASVYYGGDFSVLGHRDDSFQTTDSASKIVDALESLPGASIVASPRTEDRSPNIFLVNRGLSVRQKMVSGVEWDREGRFFDKLNFVEGGTAGMAKAEGLIISEPVAEALDVHAGDRVILLTDTYTGQRNSATLVVRGIFRDSSLFGQYTSYVDNGFLKELLRYDSSWATYVGAHFTGRAPRPRLSDIQARLEKTVSMFPLVASKGDMADQTGAEGWKGIRHSLLGLEAHLYQISQVADVFSLMSYALAGLLLGIVVLGITNTYRVVVIERTREIGTMRALGMPARGVALMFLVEAGMLSLAASCVGLACGTGLLRIASSFSLSWIPGFDVFLSKGRLAPLVDPSAWAFVLAVMIVASLLAVSGPVRSAVKISPARAFSVE